MWTVPPEGLSAILEVVLGDRDVADGQLLPVFANGLIDEYADAARAGASGSWRGASGLGVTVCLAPRDYVTDGEAEEGVLRWRMSCRS